MSVATTDLRNVAIVGHNGTGKTTLVEEFLFQANVIQKTETIESGKTVSDYTEEEIAKKISVHTSLCSFPWDSKTLNILDTPGTADFIGEAICGFRSCESALVLVDAVDGIQIETMKLWRRLNNRNKPRAIFINKMDKKRADYNQVIQQLKDQFGMSFVPISVPIGEGEDFKGVINLIENKAYILDDNGKCVAKDIPEQYQEIADSFHEPLVESAAEGADDLIMKYFDQGDLEPDDIRRGLKAGMAENKVVPVLCGQSNSGIGVVTLLNFIRNTFPSPENKAEWTLDKNGEHSNLPVQEGGKCAAYAFKTTLDQFNGKLNFVKVVTGTFTGSTDFVIKPGDRRMKAGKVYRMLGKKLIETDALEAGDIGIIAKSNDVVTNSTLLEDHSLDFTFQPLNLPTPVYTLAIGASDKKSEVKMNEELCKVAEEDLTFHTGYNKETKESYVSGLGELHINMILDKIKEKHKIKISTRLPKVAYRETITCDSGLAEYTHKKQTGGHGQYAKVVLSIAPSKKGEMYTFENVIKGGAISKGYIPGIEKGLHEQMEAGFLAGYPLVDISIKLVDGKEHPVDSSEMAFKLAARGAMRAALEKAKPVLLEPICMMSIYIETEYLGAIMSDLSSKRGRVLGQEEAGSLQVVKALVPESEVLNYVIDLKSMTSGTGSFELEHASYEKLRRDLAEKVIEDAKAKGLNIDEE